MKRGLRERNPDMTTHAPIGHTPGLTMLWILIELPSQDTPCRESHMLFDNFERAYEYALAHPAEKMPREHPCFRGERVIGWDYTVVGE
jgi:hypothetical protein